MANRIAKVVASVVLGALVTGSGVAQERTVEIAGAQLEAEESCARKLLTSTEYAQGSEVLRDLDRLGTISVVVELLGRGGRKAGLHKVTLQTDVELRLRKTGIQLGSDTALPYLYLNVNVLEDRDIFVYSIDLEVKFTALFSCDPPRTTIVPIWDATSYLGFVGKEANPERTIRDAVADLVDEFINDYLAANPRQPQ